MNKKIQRNQNAGLIVLISIALPFLAVLAVAAAPVALAVAILLVLVTGRNVFKVRADHRRRIAQHRATWGF